MRNSPRAFLIFALIIAGVCLCIAHGAVVAAERQSGFKLISLFLAVSVSQARLSCDGEAIEVQAHCSQYGSVDIVSVECDSIGYWPTNEWCAGASCSAERTGE